MHGMKYAVADAAHATSREQIVESLRLATAFPHVVKKLLDGVSDDVIRARPSDEPGAFSLLEQVWHLRDIEIGGYALRFRAVAEREHPFLPDIDGTRMATEREYASRPLRLGLDELARARARNVEYLRALPIEAFARTGELEGSGCVTLARLVANWRAHDEVHVEELDALRRTHGR